MKVKRTKVKRKAAPMLTDEPIGIVISPGADLQSTSAAFAYVWAPDPEASSAPSESKVA
jgi:hypothetical protein